MTPGDRRAAAPRERPDRDSDVSPFHRFALPYDLAMPSADPDVLGRGLDEATRPVRFGLDVGGGPGRNARALPAVDWVVVDAARGMLQRARGHGLGGIQGDAARLPVADGSVDAVLIVDALHHMGDWSGVLASAAQVLEPGGVLVVREFDPTTLRGRALVLAERVVGFDSAFLPPDDLADRMADAGLDPTVVERGFTYTVAGVKSAA